MKTRGRAELAHPLHHRTLPNGLRVVISELPHLHSATLCFAVRAGSRYERAEDQGLSHFLEHMLFRGTEAHPSAHAMNLAIERLGGSLEAATHVDLTSYTLTLPPTHVLDGIARLGEILSGPLFAGIETERRVLHEELLEDLDEDGQEVDADNLSRRALFGEHPLGYAIAGTLDTVHRFGPADLRRHFDTYYGAKNGVLSVAGPVEPGPVLDAAQAALGALPPGQRATPAPAPPPRTARTPRTPRMSIVRASGNQTDLRLSFPTGGLDDGRALDRRLLCRVLDDGMSTRLRRRIIDELGLAYDVFADAELFEDCGVFDFGASVSHERAPRLVTALLELIAEVRRDGVEPDEVVRATARLRWGLEASLDDAEAIASYYASQALFGFEDTLASLGAKADAVTPERLHAIARDELDPARAHLVCVGSLGRVESRALRDALRNAR
ncbi:MAG: insulinase family protein [Myxococcales bacterium]|nr:insulinase family protein [Myxococcales bacterium]